MIQQRDVTERELRVEECDECHVARIIGGGDVEPSWGVFLPLYGKSREEPAATPIQDSFTSVLRKP
ncbi:hypothetical protein, partial [Variovorax guangxiensis]|uniref:hypothetical protein n=1 Tax=Variovorax guangxiensis TaxID=1775474 RepID=UPI00197DB328